MEIILLKVWLCIPELLILLEHCGASQPIHLHCFGSRVSDGWVAHFPKCYFGFTAAVRHFSGEQTLGLKQVPNNRILVETDSPYLSPDRQVSFKQTGFDWGCSGISGRKKGSISFGSSGRHDGKHPPSLSVLLRVWLALEWCL